MAVRQKTVWGGVARKGLSAKAARPLLALAIVYALAPPLLAQPHPGARLPESLKKYVASNSAQPIEVIVHGTPDEIRVLAARHGLRVAKQLSEGAVLKGDAAQIQSLSAEVDHLSRDVEVSSFMAVTDAAIGADQVHAGLAGLPAYTGAGIGVALVDSGIWTGHRSLSGRVVFAKDFVGDGYGNADMYGHGTHIAATIAGSSPVSFPSGSQFLGRLLRVSDVGPV